MPLLVVKRQNGDTIKFFHFAIAESFFGVRSSPQKTYDGIEEENDWRYYDERPSYPPPSAPVDYIGQSTRRGRMMEEDDVFALAYAQDHLWSHDPWATCQSPQASTVPETAAGDVWAAWRPVHISDIGIHVGLDTVDSGLDKTVCADAVASGVTAQDEGDDIDGHVFASVCVGDD